jgi:hypothetical protein
MTEVSPFFYGQISIQTMGSSTPEVSIGLQDNNTELKPGYWQLQQRHEQADAGLPATEVSDCFLQGI